MIINAIDTPILDILDLISNDMKIYLKGKKKDINIWLRKFAEVGIKPKVYL